MLLIINQTGQQNIFITHTITGEEPRYASMVTNPSWLILFNTLMFIIIYSISVSQKYGITKQYFIYSIF